MYHRPIAIANWKMHTTLGEAITLAKLVAREAEQLADIDVAILPPVIWLPALVESLHHRPRQLSFGVQHIHHESEGAFTGEISAEMVKGLATYVLIGHSERRAFFHETLDEVHLELKAALRAQLHPVLCVGELIPSTLLEKKRGRPTVAERESDIFRQLRGALRGIEPTELTHLSVCYEPLWAISEHGRQPISGAQVGAVLDQLRAELCRRLGRSIAHEVRLLYGGSIDGKNIAEYLHQPAVDGVLVSRASLQIQHFRPILKALAERPQHRHWRSED